MFDILELNKKLVSELRVIAKELKIRRVESLRKQDLVYKILDQQAIVAAEKKNLEPKKSFSDKKVHKNRPQSRKPRPEKSQDNQRKKGQQETNSDRKDSNIQQRPKRDQPQKDDKVKPFDIDSKGMIVGEGVGMVLLKRLDYA